MKVFKFTFCLFILLIGGSAFTFAKKWENPASFNSDLENKAPKAHAGNYPDIKDEDGDGRVSVQLDGSESTDMDGEIVSYSWSIEGTGIVIATGVKPIVELPLGSTWIVLTVTDDGGLTDSQKVKIKISVGVGNKDEDKDKDKDEEEGEDKDKEGDDDKEEDSGEEDKDEEEEDQPNKAPVADAGSDQAIVDADKDGKEMVQLTAANSNDEDGRIATYSWWLNGAELATGENPSVSLGVGTHTVQLTVTDDGGLSASDEVEISISTPVNVAPVAHAGADQEKTDSDRNGRETVELDGSGSIDTDGSIEDYSWKVNEEEVASGLNPMVELPVGTTAVVLTVTDNEGLTHSDEVEIRIQEAPNEAPVADAGENQILTDEDRKGVVDVKLDGSGSTDADGEITSYSWSLAGTEIATGPEPTVSLKVGVHMLTLTVTDNDGSTNADEVEIKILPAQNLAPIAHAGPDQELTDSDGNNMEMVQLDGAGSSDEDGSIASYNWSIEGSETVLATGVNPLVELALGTAVLVLKVTDSEGLSGTDTVMILIKESQESEVDGDTDAGGEGENSGSEGEEEADGEEETGEEAGTAFLPNLFSPNGDQMNDVFTLEATHVEKVHWRIYNRQGRLVYETKDVIEATQIGWDGRAFGEAQPAGSYVWILEASYQDGSPVLVDGEMKGNVTLIR